jgi:hypothetical protein
VKPGEGGGGGVGAWRDNEGLLTLLAYERRTGVHGDVPLPQVDVRWSWWRTLAVVVGGAVGSRGSITGVVATTTATVVAILATIAAVTVVVGVVVAFIGRAKRRRGRLLWSVGRVVGVERCRSNSQSGGVQVDFLHKKIISNLEEVRKRRVALNDGPNMLEALVEAAEDVEDEDPIVDRRPQIG